jgi:hypothetical protein
MPEIVILRSDAVFCQKERGFEIEVSFFNIILHLLKVNLNMYRYTGLFYVRVEKFRVAFGVI